MRPRVPKLLKWVFVLRPTPVLFYVLRCMPFLAEEFVALEDDVPRGQ